MNRFAAFGFLTTASLAPLTPATQALTSAAHVAVPMEVTEGKMVYSANGARLAPVYRVTDDGSVQLIIDGRLITIPARLVSDSNGRLIAGADRSELIK